MVPFWDIEPRSLVEIDVSEVCTATIIRAMSDDEGDMHL
jgi:hypothetical protein